MDLQINNKISLVKGSSAGIGYRIATLLAGQGTYATNGAALWLAGNYVNSIT